jgi:hypothetical protein
MLKKYKNKINVKKKLKKINFKNINKLPKKYIKLGGGAPKYLEGRGPWKWGEGTLGG